MFLQSLCDYIYMKVIMNISIYFTIFMQWIQKKNILASPTSGECSNSTLPQYHNPHCHPYQHLPFSTASFTPSLLRLLQIYLYSWSLFSTYVECKLRSVVYPWEYANRAGLHFLRSLISQCNVSYIWSISAMGFKIQFWLFNELHWFFKLLGWSFLFVRQEIFL